MHGRAQIINSLLLSKVIYIASMFPVPQEVIKEANRIMFKFLWKGQDRVARKAMINNFENGGLNVLDFKTMVKSLRLAWLRRLCTDEDAGWKRYLRFLIKPFGGHLLFHCDYEPREYNITNKFYAELIQFWAEFRNAFSTEDDSTSIIWNNKNIRINGKPVFYRRFFDKNLISIRQLRLHLNNAESLDLIRTDLELNCNFLVWAGLRSALLVSLRGKENDVRLTNALGFYDNNTFFDATLAKSKGYYRYLIRLKATLPNSAKKLQSEFSIDATNLTMFYSLPVCLETYLCDFQFKVLKSVSMRKPGRTRQEVIQFKSPILLKLSINVGFCE